MEDKVSRDAIIKHNLQSYLSYICECVDGTHLLIHLEYYSCAQRCEISQLLRTSPVEATRKAFETLIEKDLPGIFTALLQSLKDEYPKIVKLLQGDAVKCDENYRRIVTLFKPTVIGQIHPIELLVYLRKYDVLTEEEAEEARAEERNFGKTRAALNIVTNIHKHVEDWFKYFLMSLIETDCESLAEQLDNDMVEKIKAQKEFKAANEDTFDDKTCNDVREHVQVATHEVPSTSKIENGQPDSEADIAKLKCSSLECHGDKCEQEIGMNIATNQQKDNNNTNVLYIRQEEDEVTALKQAFRQDNKKTEATENTDEDSLDEKSNLENDLLYVNDLDTPASETDDFGDISALDITTDKMVRYDREFLLSCKGSPLTKDYPTELEEFPDILIPLNLPRRPASDKWKKAREMSPKPVDTTPEVLCQQHQSEIMYGSDFKCFSTDTGNNTTHGENTELLDFDFLLSDTVNAGQKKDNVGERVVPKPDNGRTHIRRLFSGGEINRDFEAAIEDRVGEATEQSQREENGTGDTMDSTLDGEQNDLNIESEKTNQEVIEFNIPTDVDDIDAEDEDIPLREYQKELAKEGSEGENVIVLAPTNTGKTRVACSIMQVHLRRQRRSGQIGKVVFLVENEALAFQQGGVCAELLPAYRTKAISGSVQRDKKQLLKDFIDRRDILVVTAKVLLNALERREIAGLTAFSMIVFDECHHTDNQHNFNEIMSKYMNLKLRDNLDATALPQVIGLTASLGVGGKTDASAAMEHMKGILANLDAKYLCTVRQNKENLKLYENNPKEEIITAKERQEDIYREAILHIMDDIDKYMRNHQSMVEVKDKGQLLKIMSQLSSSRGTEQFLQWRSAFKDAIASVRSDAARRMLNPCRLHLEVYNKALLIHADARIKDAEAIIEEFMNYEMEIVQENETDKMLINLYRNLKTRYFSDEPENPKLLKMQKHLMNDLGNNQDARCIIFVKSRELARALINWMHEVESLKTLNAREFVGQVAPAAKGGSTKNEQKDVLEYFENGLHKVIVATSVAEEGLDITKCNLVIRYEYVTNEIVRLQSRGRARAKNSKYYVLTTEGSRIVEKEEKNAMLEKLMNYIVPALQVYIHDHPNKWEKELREKQEQQKLLEEMKQEERTANKSDDDMEFRCLNCSQFICMASDIRTIHDSHHIVINDEVNERLVSVRGRNPVVLNDEIKSRGAIFCGDPTCQRNLGGICEYRRVEFPLIVIKEFMVVDKNGDGVNFRQWKKANFEIEKFSIDDLRQVVRKRRCGAHVEE